MRFFSLFSSIIPTHSLYRYAKAVTPSLSQSESDVIESGDVWFDKELFSGNPSFSQIDGLELRSLTAEEQRFLDGPVTELCTLSDEWEISSKGKDLTAKTWRFLKDNKFFGILVPKEYGGLEFSHTALSLIIKKLISRSFTAGATMLIPNSLGAVGLLMKYGTEEQKKHYLPRFAAGDEVPAFAMTGPKAGCDLEHMPDIGYVEEGTFNGKRVLGIRLNWEKRYITMAPVATVIQVGFQTIRDGKNVGITCALVPTNLPGVTIGRRHWPARQNFMNGPTSGKNVFIPIDMVVGGEKMLGKGWRMTMEQLHGARAFSIPSLGTAAAQYVARHVGAYARLREQFKKPIGYFEGVQVKLAEIAAHALALENSTRVTMSALDSKVTPAVVSAILKYQSTDRARSSVQNGMDILGGRAIFDGPRNFLFSYYQMMPIVITVEGANILTRSFIVFGHGLMRSHKFLANVYASVRSGTKMDFDLAVIRFLGHFLTLLLLVPIRNFQGLFASKFDQRFWLRSTSARLALVTDVAIFVFAGALKKRERISGCFADVLSEMYLVSCILKCATPEDGLSDVRRWFFARARHTTEQSIKDIVDHMPTLLVRFCVRMLVQPFGVQTRLPNSALDRAAASVLLSSSIARDTLTSGIYISYDEFDKTGCLEAGLACVANDQPVPESLLRRIIDVDDFDKTEFASL